MKKLIIGGVIFLGALLIGVAIGQTTPRFEHIYDQDIITRTGTSTFTVIHDKETKQEIVCVYAFSGVSCYTTGRKW